MIQDLIDEINKKLADNPHLSTQEKQALLDLLAELNQAITELAQTDQRQAAHIADLTKTRAAQSSDATDEAEKEAATRGLQATVQKFETTHPKLVDTVNRLCVMFANLGI